MGIHIKVSDAPPTTQDYVYIAPEQVRANIHMPAVNGTIAQVKKN